MLRSPLSHLQEIAPDKRTIKGHLRRVERLTLRHAHRFIIQRIANLRDARRKALAWLILIAGLASLMMWQQNLTANSYVAEIPSTGGVYTEGVIGALDNLNPILASSPAERSGSRLLFAQLLTYDSEGNLVGELARSWWSEDNGKVYFVQLRPEAKWQDGIPITADDVVFTFNTIKNADTRSPLYTSWRNVSVDKFGDDHLVKFQLPTALASFETSLTVGILPKHAFKDVLPSEMRTADFNVLPTVASGPFTFEDLSVIEPGVHNLLRLKANPNYALGAPTLSGFHLHAYQDREVMVQAYRSREVASLNDVDTPQLNQLGNPDDFTQINAPLYHGVYAFLKTDSDVLADVKVRRALQHATDQKAIIKTLDSRVYPLGGPLLPTQAGHSNEQFQPIYDISFANRLLDEAGWQKNAEGLRSKDGNLLLLRMATITSGNFPDVAEELMRQWQELGVVFESQLVRSQDVQQNIIVPRAYDVLIYEIAIGRDPDVFAFWHSSQATQRGLNLSDYRSAKADEALDSARMRVDPVLRSLKYQSFISQWLNDVPAVSLYRPTLGYVQNKNVTTFNEHPIVDQTDRYYNIRFWVDGQSTGRPTR